MPKTETKIIETFVLGLLDISLISAGVIYLINKHWLIGIFLIVMSFLITNIILSLKHNRNKSNRELANRTDLTFNEKKSEELTGEDADEIGKALNQSGYIVAITVAVMLFYYGIKWYFAIPSGLIVGVIFPVSLFWIGILTKGKTKKSN
jgi:hypothetical protein